MSAAQPLPTKRKTSAGRYRRDVINRCPSRGKARCYHGFFGRAGQGEAGETGGAESEMRRAGSPTNLPDPSDLPDLPYFTCLLTSLVISNMLTCALPPNTCFSASSDLIMRLFFLSWRPFFLM